MNNRYDMDSKEFSNIYDDFVNHRSYTDPDINKVLNEDYNEIFFDIKEVAVYKDYGSFHDPSLICVTLTHHTVQSVEYVFKRKNTASYALTSITVYYTNAYNANLILVNIARAKEALESINNGSDFKILGADAPEDAMGFGLKENSKLNDYRYIGDNICFKMPLEKEWRRHLFEEIKVDFKDWELEKYFNNVEKAHLANTPLSEEDRLYALRVGEKPTREQAKKWMFHLMKIFRLGYHPDEKPEDYINTTTKKPTFSKEECEALKESNGVLFEKFQREIYAIGVEAQELYDAWRKE
ncbi:MAG: hypothetical protein KF802_02915 [Bdellovibrionaceae bacterium]|nr:hypothetical protein [Pseudobdellovibrionaceae bacterium]